MRTHHPGKTPAADQPGRTAKPAAGPHAAISRSAVGDVPGGRGQPLAAPVTEAIGARLGGDFSPVPVYSGSTARAAAAEAGARVYTSGSHVVAGDGGADTHILALQRSIGNAGVSRMLQQAPPCHGAGCGHQRTAPPARVQRSAVHDVLASSGQPLPAPVQEEMQARLGADFSRVRVHTDAAARASAADLGARAYTSGSHVVIGDGGADRHTLAHELTHAIQQRTGPVAGTDIGNGLKLSDPSDHDEKAAEVNAARAMRAPLSQHRPTAAAGSNIHGGTDNSRGQVVHVLDGTAGRFPGRAPIQRLMASAAFKKSTRLISPLLQPRKKIAAVDEALRAYHAVPASPATQKLTAALDALINACNDYMALPEKEAKRQPGVNALLEQATAERDLVGRSEKALRQGTGLDRANVLVTVQEEVGKAGTGGAALQGLNLELGRAIAAQVEALSGEEKIAFFRADISRLTRMSRNLSLPQVTRDVLEQVLANVGMIELTALGQAGAAFTKKPPPAPKYFMSQTVLPGAASHFLTGGARLGSVVHELTHISVSESYRNTEMMWAFTRHLPDEEIEARSSKRVRQLGQLIGLIEGIPNLQPDQKKLLNEQLNYAKRQDVPPGMVSLAKTRTELETETELEKLTRLMNKVNWYSLVEFDTVVNQCSVYMASWGVPKDQAFHERLQTVAREAYIEREAARRAQPPISRRRSVGDSGSPSTARRSGSGLPRRGSSA
jgi:hypothetical protein